MSDSPIDAIQASRRVLQDPYAYVDDDAPGGYSAILVQNEQNVHEMRRTLGNPYALLNGDGSFGEMPQSVRVKEHVNQKLHVGDLLGGKKKGSNFSKPEIEAIVRKLQTEIWKGRAKIWSDRPNVTAYDVLDPTIAIQLIGFDFERSESLGQYARGPELFEVAGIVDDNQKCIQISTRYSLEIQNFTAAHELGHAILHPATGLHRDRALDGGSGSVHRNEIEAEADIFAAFFLMPKKLVETAFKQHFLSDQFVLDEGSAFALGFEDVTYLEKKYRTHRDLARLLASAEQYNGLYFTSLAKQFQVSTEAMAIRIEELNLIG